ncbi:MAG: pyridoxamine 5-phosphate oxidase family protein [Streptosporangiaceae bacterium]|jgi:pyridoxamine 5'-phosphate oxidase family protein|nr:pyridoxamine 5-phosphate oxidase-related FMN-binding protein [Streptosporangiaceae bacterium]MDX6428863.1 pyridoxamine 5-phosphate oxidase family protein [Streptosporangiaceae bacterium]
MTLTSTEQNYLAVQRHGRLATVAPDGTPQNKPVGFRYNAGLGTIDIYGFEMAASAKFRNIQVNPDVAFVVDDVVSEGASGVRFLEIRGSAEAVSEPAPPEAHLSTRIIRIHPRRVIGWNVDPDRPGLHTRDVAVSGRNATGGDQR